MKYLKLFEAFEDFQVSGCDKSKESYDFISKYLHLIPFDDYISNDNLYQVCCYHLGELIGVRIFRMKDSKIHLNYSAVDERFRGKGINSLLFDQVLKVAKSNGVQVITSNVRQSNKSSLKSLLKSGFQINDKVEMYYPDGEKKIPLFYKL